MFSQKFRVAYPRICESRENDSGLHQLLVIQFRTDQVLVRENDSPCRPSVFPRVYNGLNVCRKFACNRKLVNRDILNRRKSPHFVGSRRKWFIFEHLLRFRLLFRKPVQYFACPGLEARFLRSSSHVYYFRLVVAFEGRRPGRVRYCSGGLRLSP